MASSIYYYDIDLNRNKLLNARLQPVTTAERDLLANGYNTSDKGILVYDTTDSFFYVWNGNIWVRISISPDELYKIDEAYSAIIDNVNISSDTENIYLTLYRLDGGVITDTLKFKYIHTQTTSSLQWTVTHNLNCFPSVTIVDSSNNEVIGEVEYINPNSLNITFSAAFSGKAYLN